MSSISMRGLVSKIVCLRNNKWCWPLTLTCIHTHVYIYLCIHMHLLTAANTYTKISLPMKFWKSKSNSWWFCCHRLSVNIIDKVYKKYFIMIDYINYMGFKNIVHEVDLCEFENNLVYLDSPRPTGVTWWHSVSKINKWIYKDFHSAV